MSRIFFSMTQRLLARIPAILLVALGAALWGADGLFRRGLALELPAGTVVFWEHLILVVVTLPLLARVIPRLRGLDGRDWIALILIGAGASALATMLFTQAFSYGDPTTPLLLQKLQPVIAILGAYALLGERLLPRYWIYFVLALGSAYLIAFSNPTNVTVSDVAPVLFAVGAAALWGLGTVLGRHLTSKIRPNDLTALRFAIGLPASVIIIGAKGEIATAASIGLGEFGTLVGLALIPGLAALAIYYRGLSGTPASAATLAEMAFPLTAIIIGWSVFDTVLSDTQWVGIIVLAVTIVGLGRAGRRGGTKALGVVVPDSLEVAAEAAA